MLREYIWNGEMDCGWADLSTLLKETIDNYIIIVLKTVELSPNIESRDLLSDECMERFKNIGSVLADIVEDGENYAYEDYVESIQNALKLNGWIILGALTETALQMFIAFYLDDYRDAKWQQWEDFKAEDVREPIFDCIQSLVDNSIIEISQARSLREAIKDKIKEHTKEHKVEKIMFDELIKLFRHLELMEEEEFSYLETIKLNRNGIHAFQKREIGTWNDLQYSVRFFCYLLEWILSRLPDIPDYEEMY